MTEPAKAEALVDRTRKFVAEIVADWLKAPLIELGTWLRRRVLLFTVGLVLLSVAIIFILVGGVQGLQSIERMPPWAPYLGVGAAAAIAGIVVLTRK